MASFLFLTVDDVLEIHSDLILAYGGAEEIRDQNALESAVAQVESTFQGEYLHSDIFEMAAAYIFHISGNHPFLDGNKRVALASGLVFLELNGITVTDPRGSLYPFMMKVASGKKSKSEIATYLRSLKKA
tara:strand:+ start:360 stop:749 length:390 start_codon:yes stop_codon:yes gene_type:complete